MSVLDEIVERVRARVKERAGERPIKEMVIDSSPGRSLREAIENAPGVPLISEIKRASPSSGDICPDVKVGDAAEAMVRGGAIGISVLTEPDYFKGELEYIPEVKKLVDVPVLRKDFVVDEYQLYETAEIGADAVLLITGVLGEGLSKFIKLAGNLGIEPLVEASSQEQLEIAAAAGAKLVGINNRDLKTMKIDLNRTKELASHVPDGATLVSESGINAPEDVRTVLEAGADAVLVGTAVMRSDDIEGTVRSLVSAR